MQAQVEKILNEAKALELDAEKIEALEAIAEDATGKSPEFIDLKGLVDSKKDELESKEKNEELDKAKEKAKQLGIDFQDDVTLEELSEFIKDVEDMRSRSKTTGKKTKFKKLIKNSFGLAGEVYSDDIVEINVGGLSDIDKKRLERSIELGLIEKA